MVLVLVSLSSCTVYFDASVPAEDSPVDTAPFVGTWEGVSLAGEPLTDPVTISMIEDGDGLRFALTAAQEQGGAEESITGELRLASIDDQTFASARMEGTVGWITLRVTGPEGDELRFQPIADAAMEQAVAAQQVSGTAQNSSLGARGLFIHEDQEGLTRFLSENPKAFDGGAEAVLRRVDAGAGVAARDADSEAADRSSEAGQDEAPATRPFSQNPMVRALLGTVAGVIVVALLMVGLGSRGRRRRSVSSARDGGGRGVRTR
jgi:hypothetical protein